MDREAGLKGGRKRCQKKWSQTFLSGDNGHKLKHVKYHLNVRITFSLWVWSNTGTCCPEGYGLHPQRVSKPNWTWCEQPLPVDIYDNYDIYDHQCYTHKLTCHVQNNLPILFNSPWSQRHTNLHTFQFPSMCFHKHLHQGQDIKDLRHLGCPTLKQSQDSQTSLFAQHLVCWPI